MRVPNNPQMLGLKYLTWRKHQKETVQDIMDYFESGGDKYILNAPTGSGKSLICMAVHKMLNSYKTYICCSTKQLQSQYTGDYPDIKMVKGRGNFNCLDVAYLKVDEAPCTTYLKCDKKNMCPYYVQRDEAMESPISVHNYSYYLPAMNYTNMWEDSELLVLDECDVAESHLTSFVATEITFAACQKALIKPPENSDDVVSWCHRTIEKLEDPYHIYKRTNLNSLSSYNVKKAKAIIKIYESLKHILSYNIDKNWCCYMNLGHRKIVLQPVWSSSFTEKYIFSNTEKTLLMSGTANRSLLETTLGLKDGDYKYTEISSVFPIENRKIHYAPLVNMDTKCQKYMLPRFVKYVDDIISKHNNDKGIIHTVSNELMRVIYDNSSHSNKMIKASGPKREKLLEEFVQSNDSKILLSPSFERGLNLPGMVKFQICSKLPRPSIGDKVTFARMCQNREWFDLTAGMRLVQQYGRGVRTENDKCTTYIIDSRISSYLHKFSKKLPKFFTEAINTDSALLFSGFKNIKEK